MASLVFPQMRVPLLGCLPYLEAGHSVAGHHGLLRRRWAKYSQKNQHDFEALYIYNINIHIYIAIT